MSDNTRPSPVKFTAQPQLQVSHLKPSAENLGGRYNMDGAKLLSLPLDSGDPSREDMDALQRSAPSRAVPGRR